MDKYIAKEIALAYMCCNNADERNLLCHVCPWRNTENCVKTEFSEELMIKVISALKGEDMKRVKLEDIKIKNYFLNANPSDKKIEKYRKYFERNEMQLKPIIVNHRGFLTDGYIQYLVLKDLVNA